MNFHPYKWNIGVLSFLLVLGLPTLSNAHVPDVGGEALQLFSYEMTGPVPSLDGNIIPTEWGEAYTRQITLTDATTATIFLMNDATYLYVGLVYEHGNNAGANSVRLYFDEGNLGGVTDGPHDTALDANNENAVSADVGGAAVDDLYFDGAAWSVDLAGPDFAYGENYYSSLFNWEFRIPLDINVDGVGDSDLNVALTEELGFLLEVNKTGGGACTCYWNQTNGDPLDATGWADIQLNVQRDVITFFSTPNLDGDPSINGDITNDPAYTRAYQRDITLTDFAGAPTILARIFGVENSGSNQTFIGIRVMDASADAGDVLRIYQEQIDSYPAPAPPAPAPGRDFWLDDQKENMLQVTGASVFTDHAWENATRTWPVDAEAADATQFGAVGAIAGGWEFEFVLDKTTGGSSPEYDLLMDTGANMGFLIEYFEASTGNTYYWENSTNANNHFVQDSPGINATSSGWAYFQTGAPFAQLVFPEDGATIEGTYPFAVFAIDDLADGSDITAVRYQFPGDAFIPMIRVGTGGFWTDNYDTTIKTDGAYSVLIEVDDNEGITLQIVATITINNAGGAGGPPTVVITAPAGGSQVSGTITIDFTAVPVVPKTISATDISVDGNPYGPTTTGVSHDLNTALLGDGAHIVRIRATDSATAEGFSEYRLYLVDNTPAVLTLLSPISGTSVSGTSVLVEAVGPANTAEVRFEISDDGGSTWYDLSGAPAATTDDTTPADGWNAVWNTTADGLADSAVYQVRATAYDSLVVLINADTETLIEVDNAPPAVTLDAIASPNNGTVTATTSALSADVLRVLFEISSDGVTYTTLGEDTTGPDFRWDWDTTAIADGTTWRFRATAYDEVGLSGQDEQVAITVDNTAPTAGITSPAGGSEVTGAAVMITYVTADVTTAVVTQEISIDGGAFAASVSPYSWDTTVLEEGSHTVRIRVVDTLGNEGFSSTFIYQVNNTPEALTLTTPLDGAFLTGTVVLEAVGPANLSEVRFDISDNSGTTYYDLAGSVGLTTDDLSAAGGWNASWDTVADGLPDGSYYVRATGLDEFSVPFVTDINEPLIVDNTNPSVTLNAVTSPTKFGSQVVSGTFIEANIMRVVVNGIEATLGAGTWSATVSLVPGANSIDVTAEDLLGQTGTTSGSITYDPNSPINVIRPDPGSGLTGSVTITVTTADVATRVEFEISDDSGTTWYDLATPAVAASTTVDSIKTDGWEQVWDTVLDGLPDGPDYQIKVTSYDENNAMIASETVAPLEVDNTPPSATFSVIPAPRLVGSQREVYVNEVRVVGSVADTGSGPDRVILEVKNANGDHVGSSPVLIPVTGGNFSRLVRLVEGSNTISATAYDKVGNVSTTVTDTIVYVIPKESQVVGEAGGIVTSPDGTIVSIPANALLENTEVSITVLNPDSLAEPTDSNVRLTSVGREILPADLVLQEPVLLTIPYNDSDLDLDQDGTPDINENDLEVYFWDGDDWVKVGVTSIDTVNNTVTVEVNHLGQFVLGTDASPIPVETKIFLTRNPFQISSETPTTFVYDMTQSGTVTIKLYDLRGDLVRTLADAVQQTAGRRSQVWDGSNDFGRYVGSGIYVFVFEAQYGDGSSEIRKKTIGVVK